MTETISPNSSWNLPPTVKQTQAIARLAQVLGYREPVEEGIRNRLEARNIIVGYKNELKLRNKR